jgi:pantothenate synthetase (EC 6.3.2.1)
MGYLHKGHVSLLEIGKPLSDELVLSIFVNPTQFGPNEDLDAYPSNIRNDLDLAQQAGVTAVFLPDKNEMYGPNYQTRVSLDHLPQYLCGRSRPVHFGGVATVVTKLFNIVMPDVAVFGKKDFQQLAIIRQMVKDLDFNIQIIGGEIIREEDGLAMSSRNAYLTPEQRTSAVCLSKAIRLLKQRLPRASGLFRILSRRWKPLYSHLSTPGLITLNCAIPGPLSRWKPSRQKRLWPWPYRSEIKAD